ncbi:hypothetical protein Tco_0930679, partial [Tanacetum coccineum]
KRIENGAKTGIIRLDLINALTLVRANGITPRGEEELFFSKCISVERKNDPTVEIEAYYGSNSNRHVEATQRLDRLLIFDDPR